jgi:hypothetical protein
MSASGKKKIVGLRIEIDDQINDKDDYPQEKLKLLRRSPKLETVFTYICKYLNAPTPRFSKPYFRCITYAAIPSPSSYPQNVTPNVPLTHNNSQASPYTVLPLPHAQTVSLQDPPSYIHPRHDGRYARWPTSIDKTPEPSGCSGVYGGNGTYLCP